MTSALQAQRRTSSTDWAIQNPVLDSGEFAFETDTRIYKVGDGVSSWKQLTPPYIPSKLFNAKGDLITRGMYAEELLTNNTMTVDSNNDGIADGWSLVGSDSSHTIVTPSGQSITSAASQTTSITRAVKVEPGYTYNYDLYYKLTSQGSDLNHQLEVVFDLYSDVNLTTLVSSNIIDYYSPPSLALNTPDHDFYHGSALVFDSVGYLRITLKAHNGAGALYTYVSITRLQSKVITLHPVGAVPGSTLYVDAQGNLRWTTTSQADKMAPYIKSTTMASTYKTKNDANAAHSQFLLSADAAATYETVANANIAHALHQYAAAAATNYHTPASLLAAGYEPNDQLIFLTADQTVTNSTVQVPTALAFAMDLNGSYLFELFLVVSGTTAGGMRISNTGSTVSSYIFGIHGPVNGAGVTSGNVHQAVTNGTGAAPGTQSVGLAGVGTKLVAIIRGTVINGAAGNFVFTFAQNTAAASTQATIHSESFIRAVKIA